MSSNFSAGPNHRTGGDAIRGCPAYSSASSAASAAGAAASGASAAAGSARDGLAAGTAHRLAAIGWPCRRGPVLRAGAARWAPAWALRTAIFIQLDEFIFARRQRRRRNPCPSSTASASPQRIQLCRPHGVVIARNDVVDLIRRTVGIHDTDHGNTQHSRFVHGNLLVTDINHEDRVGQAARSLIPPRLRSSFSCSRRSCSPSFLVSCSMAPVGLHLPAIPPGA